MTFAHFGEQMGNNQHKINTKRREREKVKVFLSKTDIQDNQLCLMTS